MINKAYKRALDKYLSREDVTGVSIGYKFKDGKMTDEICISIGVKEKKPLSDLSKKEVLPKTILKVKTDVVELNIKPALQTARLDPLQGGVSIGREGAGYSGTLGCIVFKGGDAYVLTNYHVACPPVYLTNEYVIQPSGPDGGRIISDRIGKVEKTNIDANGDFAIIKIDAGSRQYNQILYGETESISSISTPTISDLVSKSGRTTGETSGIINGVGTYAVDYSAFGKGTINLEGFSFTSAVDPNDVNLRVVNSGDSGSCAFLTSSPTIAVGIVTAATMSAPYLGICCYITRAFALFGLKIKQEPVSIQPDSDVDNVVNVLNIPWMDTYLETEQTLTFIFDNDYDYVHLYVDPEYEGALEAKVSSESYYKTIMAYSQIPSCVLGSVESGVAISVNIKITTYTDLVGHQIIPIYVSYGNSSVTGLNIPDFAWRNDETVIGIWADDDSSFSWLSWRESS